MSEKLFMAVDLGTSFIKSGVYSLDGSCLQDGASPSRMSALPPAFSCREASSFTLQSVPACARQLRRWVTARKMLPLLPLPVRWQAPWAWMKIGVT